VRQYVAQLHRYLNVIAPSRHQQQLVQRRFRLFRNSSLWESQRVVSQQQRRKTISCSEMPSPTTTTTISPQFSPATTTTPPVARKKVQALIQQRLVETRESGVGEETPSHAVTYCHEGGNSIVTVQVL